MKNVKEYQNIYTHIRSKSKNPSVLTINKLKMTYFKKDLLSQIIYTYVMCKNQNFLLRFQT